MGEKMFYPIVFVCSLGVSLLSPKFCLTKSFDLGMDLHLMISLVNDSLGLSFLLVVLLVSVSVFLYSQGYMGVDLWWDKFISILSLFVFSMILLTVSGSLLFCMLGWDGLGLSSVALIFFYRGWNSFRSGLVTFYCNRMGDILMIACICLLLSDSSLLECSVLLVLGALTKSAQFPFHVWLPMAMAAPTPVSSLVHSSTLVTAGVYMCMRFSDLISPISFELMFYLSLMTLIYSGLGSILEQDLKKIVAYSTLVHLSLMVGMFSLGDYLPSLIHLVCHAFMKSSLFMMSGYAIHQSSGSQDVRNLTIPPFSGPFFSVVVISSSLSMVGVPFLSGYFSKENMLLLSLDDSTLSFSVILVYLGLFFTSAYSTRILVSVFSSKPLIYSMCIWLESKKMLAPSFLTFPGLLILGGVILFKNSDVLFSETFFLSSSMKFGVLVWGILGIILGASPFLNRTLFYLSVSSGKTLSSVFPTSEFLWITQLLNKKSVEFIENLKFNSMGLWEGSKLSPIKLLIMLFLVIYLILVIKW